MKIEIIHEDENILAINKPAGLVVHADGRSKDKTLVDWILENYPDIRNVGEPIILNNEEEILRPGIVHRLDKETSGILMIAKNEKTFEYLKNLFKERKIKKEYRAIVWGKMTKIKNDEGIIDKPIGKSRSDFRMYSAEFGARGTLREAITEYKVLKEGDRFSYIEVRPKTGRTHQIRVHFKAIGNPVLCDSLYAKKKPCELGMERLALHAFSLEFDTQDGQKLVLKAPIPNDLEMAIKAM